MKARATLFAALAFALASTASQAPAQEAAGLSEEDVAAIHELFQRFDDTANTGDAEDWMTLLADDVQRRTPRGRLSPKKGTRRFSLRQVSRRW